MTNPNPYFERDLASSLAARMFQGKILVVTGPRQTGKTTLIAHFLSRPEWADRVLSLNGDDTDTAALLADASPDRIRMLLGRKNILFLDEAQRIPSSSLVLKRLADSSSDLQIIVSGSSSLDLADRTAEPLTGRKFEWVLLPFSFAELAARSSPLEERRLLERRLVFGSYPDIATHPGDETDRLRVLVSSYLFKDVFRIRGIRHTELLERLLRAIALQCGSEVSFCEVARTIGTDDKTVVRYLDLLERCFVVFRLPSYARNLRNELRKSRKIYFFDNGVRNAILGDFRPMPLRTDAGVLWENHLMAERLKWRLAREPDTRAFFWRTADQKEIDLVEESADGLRAFEFKWNPKKAVRPPKAFLSAYPGATFATVTPGNFDTFLLPPSSDSGI